MSYVALSIDEKLNANTVVQQDENHHLLKLAWFSAWEKLETLFMLKIKVLSQKAGQSQQLLSPNVTIKGFAVLYQNRIIS